MSRKFAPLDLFSVYRDEVLSILGRHGFVSPRLAGVLGEGADVRSGDAFELFVEASPAVDGAIVDESAAAGQIADLIGRPLMLVVCAVGQEPVPPGVVVVPL